MKTEYKYVSYREDKQLYVVSIRIKGKNVQKTFATLETALQYRAQLLALHGLTKNLGVTDKHPTEVPTFCDGMEEFIEEDVKYRDALATVLKYDTCRRMYGKYVGRMKIDAISHSTWQDIFTARQESRGIGSQNMTADYRHIRDMYAYFQRKGVIKSNPLEKPVRITKTKRMTRRGFTEEEQKAFLREAKNYDYQWFFLFSLYFMTGCRRGELVALRWEDVDFAHRCLQIRHGITCGMVDGERREIFSTPKTPNSVRSIPISDKVNFILRMRYEQEHPKEDMFVFRVLHPTKYPWISLGSIGGIFRRIRDRAGLDSRLTLHSIRHTVASRLVTSGIDLATVQKIGGWSSPTTVLSIYAHSTDDAVRDAMSKVLFGH